MFSSSIASHSHFHDVFLDRLALEPAVLVHIESAQGSVPREAGAWMAVFANVLVGTVGGGHLEHAAVAQARAHLKTTQVTNTPSVTDPVSRLIGQPMRFALGPALGQCCGGVVHLRFEPVTAQDVPALTLRLRRALLRTLVPVAVFGGGHVGHAVARILVNLPFALTWIDSRDGVFPADLPSRVVCEHSEPVQAAVRHLAPQSRVLIMSFSHAEDLDVLAACLQRQRDQSDLPYIGLIGSQTKWATFRQRLAARGFTTAELAHVTSPIGVPGIVGKEPDVIAVAVAAQLLQTVGHDFGKTLA